MEDAPVCARILFHDHGVMMNKTKFKKHRLIKKILGIKTIYLCLVVIIFQKNYYSKDFKMDERIARDSYAIF